MFGRKEVAVKEKPVITNFDYIEAAISDVLEKPVALTDANKKEAKEKSRAFVAGFSVFDPNEEKKHLDSIIEKRNKSIQSFKDDREAVKDKLFKLNVMPLAVVPKKAWVDICRKAALIVMQPDGQGQVTVSYNAIRSYGSKAAIEQAAKDDPVKFVRSLFPETPTQGILAKVILPTPPADVAETLLKAKSLALSVAAVPEAISFVQTPSELFDATAHPKDEWARRQGYEDYQDWVKRDPIVFHEHKSAVAVIAQFGDFPIEKAVVDLVVEADDFLSDPSVAINAMALNDVNQIYADQARFAQEQQRLMYEAQRQQSLLLQAQSGVSTSGLQWFGTGVGVVGGGLAGFVNRG